MVVLKADVMAVYWAGWLAQLRAVEKVVLTVVVKAVAKAVWTVVVMADSREQP